MTFEEIKQLHEMGFSADQIITLSGTPEPKKEPEKDPEPAPEPNPEPTPEPKPQNEQITGQENPISEQLQNQINEQQKQIQQLTKQIQAHNRQQARIETLPEDDLLSKTDKIMAELIRPTFKEDDKK